MIERDDLEYVGFWPRVGASLIDTLIILVICIPITIAIYGSSYWAGTSLVLGPADVIVNWVMPAVAVVVLWIVMQATPGKMAISARIVDASTGGHPTATQFVLRYLGYFVSAIPFFLGLIWVAIDERHQGWHDKIARTVVVRKKHRGKVVFDG